jgi:excisionase family DNA binding protein
VSPAGLCSTLVPLFGGEQQSPMGRTAESHGAKDKARQVTSMEDTTALPELWDLARLAAYLGTEHRFVYRLTEQHRIRFVRVGGRLRFDPADVAEYLRREAEEPTAEPIGRRRPGRPRNAATKRAR